MKQKVNVFWFRRALRLDDNVGFCKALQGKHPVLPIFIFDSEILGKLSKDDARVTFIHDSLQGMQRELSKFKSSIGMYFGNPLDVF